MSCGRGVGASRLFSPDLRSLIGFTEFGFGGARKLRQIWPKFRKNESLQKSIKMSKSWDKQGAGGPGTPNMILTPKNRVWMDFWIKICGKMGPNSNARISIHCKKRVNGKEREGAWLVRFSWKTIFLVFFEIASKNRKFLFPSIIIDTINSLGPN